MDRRTFLIRTSSLLAAATPVFRPIHARAAAIDDTAAEIAGLGASQWRTIALVQDHLFPSEPGAPGAKDINAAGYLQSVLTEPRRDPADRAFIKDGLHSLERFSHGTYKNDFSHLSISQREAVLRQLEQNHDGRNWISMLLEYILEALLTDPVYGGNPVGIGWRWLGHQPGFPRPPAALKQGLL